MQFTREQLLQFSKWESVHPDFNRNGGTIESRLVQEVIEPFQRDLQQKHFAYTVIENGGLTNYYGIWVRKAIEPREYQGTAYFLVPGVTVYLSLLGPFAAVGRVAGDYFSTSHHLSPENLIDPDFALSDLESEVVASLLKTRYAILTPHALAQQLPDDIRPFEYCLCAEPWNTLFHVMFANTD
jgi:hypothetical protein